MYVNWIRLVRDCPRLVCGRVEDVKLLLSVVGESEFKFELGDELFHAGVALDESGEEIAFIPRVWGAFSLIYLDEEGDVIVGETVVNRLQQSGHGVVHYVALHLVLDGDRVGVTGGLDWTTGAHGVDEDMGVRICVGKRVPCVVEALGGIWLGTSR